MAEAERLQRILGGMGTTLEEDRAALQAAEAAEAPRPWVRDLLRFRVTRKAALRARVAALRARVESDGGRGEL